MARIYSETLGFSVSQSTFIFMKYMWIINWVRKILSDSEKGNTKKNSANRVSIRRLLFLQLIIENLLSESISRVRLEVRPLGARHSQRWASRCALYLTALMVLLTKYSIINCKKMNRRIDSRFAALVLYLFFFLLNRRLYLKRNWSFRPCIIIPRCACYE